MENRLNEESFSRGAGTPPSAEKRAFLRFFRAPLLWILLPQIVAYTLCECGFSLPENAVFVAACIAFALALFAAFFADVPETPVSRFGKFSREIWAIAFPLAAFFLAGAWWSVNAPCCVDWSSYSETEVVAELEIETPFRSPGKFWSGLARVRAISEDCSALAGTRIFYRFNKTETAAAPQEGTLLRMRGLTRDVLNDAWYAAEFREFLRFRRVSAGIFSGDRIEISERAAWKTALSRQFKAMKFALIEKLVDPRSPREREQRALAAMALGERSLLSREQNSDFTLSGTMHIFAVSGLHVSLVAGLLFFVLSRFRVPFGIAAGTTIFAAWFYVQLTGAAPSAMRAWMMFVFLFAARLFNRSANPLTALVAAASVALWCNPSLLCSPGFQLSYAVVASIFLYGIPLGDFLRSRLRPFRYIPAKSLTFAQRCFAAGTEKFCSAFAISCGTFIAGAAFIAANFGIFTPLAILANLFLVPAAGLLLGLALAAAVLFYVPACGCVAAWLWEIDAHLMFAAEVLTGTIAGLSGDFATAFPHPRLGTLGGALVLAAFAVGAFAPFVRERAVLRFAFPPLFLLAYLLAFAF